MHGDYLDPDKVDWRALEHARMQAVSGVAYSVHLIAQAIDDLGARMAAADRGLPWKPISDRIPAWPDERDPRFRKEPTDGTV
jgi:hypothetical protein